MGRAGGQSRPAHQGPAGSGQSLLLLRGQLWTPPGDASPAGSFVRGQREAGKNLTRKYRLRWLVLAAGVLGPQGQPLQGPGLAAHRTLPLALPA